MFLLTVYFPLFMLLLREVFLLYQMATIVPKLIVLLRLLCHVATVVHPRLVVWLYILTRCCHLQLHGTTSRVRVERDCWFGGFLGRFKKQGVQMLSVL